jgi:hypothetical protein
VTTGLAADAVRLREAATALIERDVAGIEPGEAATVHRQLRATCDQVLAFAARLLARVEDDGRWAASGARTFADWAAGQTRSSVGAARREALLGQALETTLPTTARAVGAGEISLEHAQVLARRGPTSGARKAALASDLSDRNEAALVAKAKRLGVDEFDRECRRWAARIDSDAHEREHRNARSQERLSFARRDHGVAFDGFLTAEHADVLVTALTGIVGVPSADDGRTPDQRRAAALTGLAQLALDRGWIGGGAQVRPHISVHVPWESFRQMLSGAAEDGDRAGLGRLIEPAELDNGEPLPRSVFGRIACDSSITRIVFGPDGEPLDVGRAQRTFTGAQRRAVVARDRFCRYPGCHRPPAFCEVHHVRWWARDDGPTAVWNGILLCWHHHDLVHQREVSIRRSRDDGWEFRGRDGKLITGAPAPGTLDLVDARRGDPSPDRRRSGGVDRGANTGVERGASAGVDRGASTGADRGASTGVEHGASAGALEPAAEVNARAPAQEALPLRL